MKKSISGTPTVAACVPYYKCAEYIEEAIGSLQAQQTAIDEIFVVSDGDPEPPWDLRIMQDERIRQIELDSSMGPFFAIDLVMRISRCDFVLIQDSDDWSDRSRVEMLARELLARPHLTAATSAQLVHDGGVVRYESLADRFGRAFSLDALNDRLRHHGMYRRKMMLARGGYFGGFKYAFDAYLTGMLYVTSGVSVIDAPLYNRRVRRGSLTRSPDTGMSTPRRQAIAKQLAAMTADLAVSEDNMDPREIAKVSSRFLDAAAGEHREEIVRNLSTVDLNHAAKVVVPASLRSSLIE